MACIAILQFTALQIEYSQKEGLSLPEGAIYRADPWWLPEVLCRRSARAWIRDAHEGIRPTYTEYTPDSVKEYLTRDQLRLYTIIWERFVSSQMNNAKTTTTSVEITAGDAVFRASASKISEKGFYNVIKLLSSKEDKSGMLPALKQDEVIQSNKFHPEQHFTQGPARYTDASIVRTLEEKGIGRPSTYAPIISVLLDRYYIKIYK